MKTHPAPAPGNHGTGNQQRRRGVALLTVLTIISLSTILILTFFQLAQNEMVASDAYNNGLEAQQIADQAVNLVIRQIRQATSQENVGWASQPGAIRTWEGNGRFYRGYKLYSDDQMVVDGQENQMIRDDFMDLADWDKSDAPDSGGDNWQFVDLNEPVIRGDKVYYPIVDPSARETPEWPQGTGFVSKSPFDGQVRQRGIEGFDYKLTNVFGGKVEPGPLREAISEVRPSDGINREPLPMPVRWLYQLKDGSLGYLNDSKSFVPVSGGATPSEKNPIVSRFAFWADDETAKLNPNVHAGGLAWDTPKASGLIDRNMGRFQPAQHEWQRYPGHPATTHLAPVLAPGVPDIVYNRDNMELLFGLVPRIVGGGSMSGTAKVDMNDPKEQNGLVADKDRLYATLDEFLLEPGSKQHPPTRSGSIREPNFFPDPKNRRGGFIGPEEVPAFLERTKFFLSVVSRAPETTVFNTPRVSIWPTRYDKGPGFRRGDGNALGHHTPFDRLIRFCAEVGEKSKDDPYIYHFQRQNADSATEDYEQIERNQTLLNYLEKLTRTQIPGLGKDFRVKYSEEERLQILTLIFDYIRSTNLHDDSLFGERWRDAFSASNQPAPLTYTNPRKIEANDRTTHKGHGQVTPIQIDWGAAKTNGLGRFNTLLEVGVHVIACADGADGLRGGAGPTSGNSYPGISQYPNGFFRGPVVEDMPSGQFPHYSNFPPMPNGVERGVKTSWPQWLRDMDDPDHAGYAPDLIDYAFDERRWNWQLAWLDPQYVDKVTEDPSAGKFNRANLDMGAWMNGDTRLGARSGPMDTYRPNERLLQSTILMQMFTPAIGWVPINPDMEMTIKINGMTFPSSGGLSSMPGGSFTEFAGSTVEWGTNNVERASHHDRHYGGTRAYTFFLRADRQMKNRNDIGIFNTDLGQTDALAGVNTAGRPSPIDRFYASAEKFNRYPFITRPWRTNTGNVDFDGGSLEFEIYSAGSDSAASGGTRGTAATNSRQLVQRVTVEFPEFAVPAPNLSSGHPGYRNEFNRIERGPTAPIEEWSLSWDGINPHTAEMGRLAYGDSHRSQFVDGQDVLQSVAISHGDPRVVAILGDVPTGVFLPNRNYGNQRMAHGFATTTGSRLPGADMSAEGILVDIPRVRNGHNFGYHNAKLPLVIPSVDAKTVQLYGDFDNGFGLTPDGPYTNKADEGNTHSLFKRTDPNALNLGAFEMARDYGDFPYFVRDWIHEAGSPSYFSPNRIISSPGQFGSLPVGSRKDADGKENRPWRTLLFRPDVKIDGAPAATGGDGITYHPGAISPHDHYLLDLFWMPVVEPYAISEPLSTGGKVNLNYQILPFRHIHRSTAIRGVFKSEYMVTIPNQWAFDYKVGVGRGSGYHWRDRPYGGALESKSLRSIILEDETLAQFEEKFNGPSEPTIFRSASEICEIHLVPQEQSVRMKQGGASASIGLKEVTVQDMADGTFWKDNAVVGDNSRERPYANIYGRVTTKSNTFKVHYRAQVLTKAKGSDPAKWEPLVDQVVAEYRGASIVERYVDPNDPEIPDYAELLGGDPTSGINAEAIDKFYRYRVLHPTRFSP